jgi:hemoglobin
MYGRLLADPLLEPFFRDTDMDWLVASQTAFVSQALGGPREYRGKSMKEAHAGVRIEPRHFDRFASHLGAALGAAGVSEALQGEIFAAFAALRRTIINAGVEGEGQERS